MTRLCTIPIYNSYLLEGCFICRFIGNLLFSQFLEMKYRIAYLFIKISFYSSYKNVDFFPINLLNRCFYEQEGSCIDVNCKQFLYFFFFYGLMIFFHVIICFLHVLPLVYVAFLLCLRTRYA